MQSQQSLSPYHDSPLFPLIYCWHVQTACKKRIWVFREIENQQKPSTNLKASKWQINEPKSCCFQMQRPWNTFKRTALFSLKCWYFSSSSFPFECTFITENRFISFSLLHLMLPNLNCLCLRWEGHVWIWLNLKTQHWENVPKLNKRSRKEQRGLILSSGLPAQFPDFTTCSMLNCGTEKIKTKKSYYLL